MQKEQGSCEYCSNYVFDEEEDSYICMVDMDEDDYARLLQGRKSDGCPYFTYDNEYKIVRHQM
jgi:hypothetical protein